MPGRKDWTGQRFGRLVAISFVGESITTPFGFLGAIAIDAGQPLPAKICRRPVTRRMSLARRLEKLHRMRATLEPRGDHGLHELRRRPALSFLRRVFPCGLALRVRRVVRRMLPRPPIFFWLTRHSFPPRARVYFWLGSASIQDR
jgi:hypothetical protein